MTNFKEESRIQKLENGIGSINHAPDTHTPILDPTSQRSVQKQSQFSLSNEQYIELKWLIEQNGQVKPAWLRRKFKLNQRRAKLLNDCLREAQLDAMYCGKCSDIEDWPELLHAVWHEINGVVLCG